ncbi:MAG: hypothetical protein GY862_12175 [Gammaproteobacteria bacterium]|nr:hypothetical protein [Gammaproteobacteria bacterium]
MATKLIELEDGTFVEVTIPGDQIEQISGGTAERVDGAVDRIKPILLKTCKPIMAVWEELNKEMTIDQAEVELGIGFEAEGGLFVAKGKANANLTVKLILKPKA